MDGRKREHKSFVTLVENMWSHSLGIIGDIFKLFSLEVKLASRSLATIFIFILLAGLLLLSCWFCALAALVIWLTHFHISLVLSLLLIAAFNLIVTIAIALSIMKISKNLQFKETRKQLELMRGNHETDTSED